MGVRNYLIEGLSGSGKTSVCDELLRRGHQAIHGDRTLAYQGDPETGEPSDTADHFHHIWDVDKVRTLVADKTRDMTFFCGGWRNFHRFIDLFDHVFVLEVDSGTLGRRLSARPADEFGGTEAQRAFVLALHAAGADVPGGIRIDAKRPVGAVVDDILAVCIGDTPG